MGKFIKKNLFLIILFNSLSFQASMTQIHIPNTKTQEAVKSQIMSKNFHIDLDYGKIPLYFVPNKGQVDEQALFYAKASRYTLWLTREGLVFDSIRKRGKISPESQSKEPMIRMGLGDYEYEREVSRLVFLNANKSPQVIPVSETEHRVNYFIGSDKSRWKTDIKTSKAVLYKELYGNIDLKIYGLDKEIEYDWVVRPGGEVEDIRFEYIGVEETSIDRDGTLAVETEFGEVIHRTPKSYQVIEEEKYDIEVMFREVSEDVYGFEAGSYREDHELVIDPVVLAYSTYLGGSIVDIGHDITVDSIGNAYLTGATGSPDFPTVNSYMTGPRGRDVFVTKLSPAGDVLVYSTYIGGSIADEGFGIAIDSDGSAYVTGGTASSDFPTANPYMTDPEGIGDDVFVTKLIGIPSCYIFDGHDFDGNGSSNVSVFRPSNGRWYIKGVGSYTWGTVGDIPINGDYNGDGKTDVAVWRPSNSMWYIKDVGGTSWGISGDIPVPGDYNGDGRTEIAVWRPSNGRWYVKGIGNFIWGQLGDIPIPGDFDGNGRTDAAVWRPSNGLWYIRERSSGPYAVGMLGKPGDIPVPGDYDGDGITDCAVWRPSNGRWYSKGVAGISWGTAGDIPVPGDYNGDGITDIAVWRPSNGRWYIRGIGGYSWGTIGDIPLVR
jgi:hypothetical protein